MVINMNRASFFEIIKCLEQDSVLKLITTFSGRNIYIPMLNPKNGGRSKFKNQILESIGNDALEKLMTLQGGKQVYIPNGYSEVRQARDRQIAMEYDGSETLAELAIKHGLSYRTISNGLKKNGVSPRSIKKTETLIRKDD